MILDTDCQNTMIFFLKYNFPKMYRYLILKLKLPSLNIVEIF